MTLLSAAYIQRAIGFVAELRHLNFASAWVLGALAGAALNLIVINLVVANHYMQLKGRASRKIRNGAHLTIALAIFCLIYILYVALCLQWSVEAFLIEVKHQPDGREALAAHLKEYFEHKFWLTALIVTTLSFIVIGIDAMIFPDAFTLGFSTPEKLQLVKERRDSLMWFDFKVAVVVAITLIVPFLQHRVLFGTFAISENHEFHEFSFSFKAGAVAFEILLACFLFDPRHFIFDDQLSDRSDKREIPGFEAGADRFGQKTE